MSAKLVNEPNVLHDFRDDLESSLYVLLWTTMMYSVLPEREQVERFLKYVLDPAPSKIAGIGGFGKDSFLFRPSFLINVEFPNREALHTLMKNLANLFQFRYEKPPDPDARAACEFLQSMILQSITEDAKKYFTLLLEDNAVRRYDLAMDKLSSHAATIKLFDIALSDRSKWPIIDDPATNQGFTSKPAPPVTKSDWQATAKSEQIPE